MFLMSHHTNLTGTVMFNADNRGTRSQVALR
jgi:hypothetical protein